MGLGKYASYIVDEERRQGEGLDCDRCTYTWENLYIPLYSDLDFWKGVNFSNCRRRARRGHRGYVEYRGDGFTIKVSGDSSFNFKRIGNGSGKLERYRGLIERDYANEAKVAKRHIDELHRCNAMLHSLHNFALMPVTGSLNNFKGCTDGNLDRLDCFLVCIDDYYRDPDRSIRNSIFSRAIGREGKERSADENTAFIKSSLKGFLDLMDSVYEYCRNLYLIESKEFVDRLVENGKKPIDSGQSVVDYMGLAQEFWALRHDAIASCPRCSLDGA